MINVTAKRELASIFPEAIREYVIPKIKSIRQQIAQLEQTAEEGLQKSAQIPDGWFLREYIKAFEIAEILRLQREVRRLRCYLPVSIQRKKGLIDEERIERAKEYLACTPYTRHRFSFG